MTDELMTVAEVAEILRLNEQTVRNWIDAGSLPAIRIGRRVRIKRSDFDHLVEAGYSGTKETPEPAPNLWDGEVPDPEVP